MIIAVTGWRYYTDAAFIRKNMVYWADWCDAHSQPLHVRVGDAEGADAHVRRWCRINKISYHEFKAARYPSGALLPGAGPERNRRMLLGRGDPFIAPTDLLLGFPRHDGGPVTVPGSGTWGCAINAANFGIKVEIPAYIEPGEQ